MFKQITKLFAVQASRNFSCTRPNNFQVTVCGAGGGIGQPLSLLLKLDPLVTRLNLYDIVRTVGVAADLSHIDTKSEVRGFEGKDKCGESLQCSDVILVTAGTPLKCGKTYDELFEVNAGIIKDIMGDVAKHNPEAIVGIITNPINSMVPIAAEVLKKRNVFNPKHLFGITTLSVVRSRTFVGQRLRIDPEDVEIDVVCGHSGVTIIPIFSQCKPKYEKKDVAKAVKKVQEADIEVVTAKKGTGSSVLAMAYSAAIFTGSLLRALNGVKGIVECAFVQSNISETDFFASPILLGKNGLEMNCGIPKVNEFERRMLCEAMPVLREEIEKAVKFGKK